MVHSSINIFKWINEWALLEYNYDDGNDDFLKQVLAEEQKQVENGK